MKKLLKILVCSIFVLGLTGCGSNEEKENNQDQSKKEQFMIGHTLDDGRIVHFTFDVPYNDSTISEALANKQISIDDFINKLDYVEGLKDGGSKVYKYDKNKKDFGEEEFYVVVCNTMDNIKDIYVARYRESLNGKCEIKVDSLEGVSMTIKDGTLTRTGATIIITDVSDRNNIYGDSYRIDKKENGEWIEVRTIIEDYAWNAIGYSVNENNRLEKTISWEWLYGKLENGEYRIVKDTSEAGEGTRYYITAEFIIK